MTDTPSLRFIHAPSIGSPTGYSHAAEVRGGRTVYFSGQIALDADGNVVGAGNFEAQARQVFRNLGLVLDAAGLDFGAVVKLTIFLTETAHLQTFRPDSRRVRESGRPAREHAGEGGWARSS
ncbi:RidA family protein [Deinococcus sp. KSM4-11]|uniref:RidA family protein n=1 Tax=Deinococcus sp. KSM4-11 TaxID=2568654 RepID=UPI001F0E2AE3|nr:RidA family protein [Deinococcus sp. KSM4-11]